MAEDFKVFNHGKNQINLMDLDYPIIMMVSQLHYKEDGDVNNEPSLAVVLESPHWLKQPVGEISLKMLNEGLNELGYKIVKK